MSEISVVEWNLSFFYYKLIIIQLINEMLLQLFFSHIKRQKECSQNRWRGFVMVQIVNLLCVCMLLQHILKEASAWCLCFI